MNQSVFFEEWRRCLQAHYQDVIQRRDGITEKSLVPVLYRVGFTQDELRTLYIEATMHVDAVGSDFVPSAEMVAPTETVQEAPMFIPHPAECSCPACLEKVDLLRHDRHGHLLDANGYQEALEEAAFNAPDEPKPSDTHVQRTLF